MSELKEAEQKEVAGGEAKSHADKSPLHRQRAHLETAATKLRLGADEGVVTAELRAAGAWIIDRPAEAPWTR